MIRYIPYIACRHLKLKLGDIFEGIYNPDAFELWLQDDLEGNWCGIHGEAVPRESASLDGLGDKALAELGANTAAATSELECIMAKRLRVRMQLEALELNTAPLVVASEVVALKNGENKQASTSEISGGKLPEGLSAKGIVAIKDSSDAHVSVSMAPVDNSMSGALYEGWVKRKAAHMPYSYQKQYAVLKAGGMFFFEKPGGVLKEHLDLNAGIVISPSDGFKRITLTAAVRKEVILEVPTSEQQDCWIEKLMAESGRVLRRRHFDD